MDQACKRPTWASLIAALVLACLLSWALPMAAHAADEPSLTTDKEVYEVGEPIMVTATFDSAPTNSQWVGIYKVEDGDTYGADPSFYWYYVTADNNGTAVELTASERSNNRAGWGAGDYRVVLFADGDYTVAKTTNVTLKNPAGTGFVSAEEAAASYALATDKAEYKFGEAINVTASAQRTSDSDLPWVAIYKKGDLLDGSDSSVFSYFWYYLDTPTNWHGFDGPVKSGETVNILETAPNWRTSDLSNKALYAGDSLDPGDYEVVLYAQGTYSVQKTVDITVVPTDEFSLALEGKNFETGVREDEDDASHKLQLKVTANTGGNGGWVGIYKASETPKTDKSIAFYYVDGVTTGKTVDLTNADETDWYRPDWQWTPGDYKIILFGDGGYDKQVKQIDFTIKGHSYELERVAEKATEDDNGTGIYKCTTCGNSFEGPIYYDVQEFEAAVDALGEVTLDKAEAVEKARAAYNEIKEEHKALMKQSALAALEDAEAAVAKFQKDAEEKAAAEQAAKEQAEKAAAEKAAAEKAAEEAKKTVTVNVSKVTASAVAKAVKKAGSSSKKVTTIVLGSKVKSVSKNALAKYGKVKTVVVKTKKLTKKSVKGCLGKSKVKTVTVAVSAKKATNKTYAAKYKKIFTKKNCGKSVKVTR